MYDTNAINIRLAVDKTAYDEIALVPVGSDPSAFVPAALPLDLIWGNRTYYKAGSEANYALIRRRDGDNREPSFSLVSTDYLDPDVLPDHGYDFPESAEIEAVEAGLKTVYEGCCEIARIGVDLVPADLPFRPVHGSDFRRAVSEWTKAPSPCEEDIRRSIQRDAHDSIDRLGIIMEELLGIPVGKDCVFSISGDGGCAEMKRSAEGKLKISTERHLFESSYLEYSIAKNDCDIILKDVPVSPYGIITSEEDATIYRGNADAFGEDPGSVDHYLYGSCGPGVENAGLIGVNSFCFGDPSEDARICSELTKALYGWLYITCMLTGKGSAGDMYPFRLLCELLQI